MNKAKRLMNIRRDISLMAKSSLVNVIIELLLDLLPHKKLICSKCGTVDYMLRGAIRRSRRLYDGPYCPQCGNNQNGKRRVRKFKLSYQV